MTEPTPTVPPNTLTMEESAVVAQAMFDPTVNRIVVLLQTLIQATASGDYAIWASLVALDKVVADLDWTTVQKEHAVQFAHLAELVFKRSGERLGAYRLAVQMWSEGAESTFPTLQPWGNDDTVAVMSEIQRIYQLAEVPADAPAEPV